MKIPHFNLNGARNMLSTPTNAPAPSPSRRKFVKTLGLGAVAITPAVNSLKSVTLEPFTIQSGDNRLQVLRHGMAAWEIAPERFAPGAHLAVRQLENEWRFSLEKASYPGTLFLFSFSGRIFREEGAWQLEARIPELQIHSKIDFLDWLDGIQSLTSPLLPSREICRPGEGGLLQMTGPFHCRLDAQWLLTMESDRQAELEYCGNHFHTSTIVLQLHNGRSLRFIHSVSENGTLITLPGFPYWNSFTEKLSQNGHSGFTADHAPVDLQLFTGVTSRQRPVAVLWTHQPARPLALQTAFRDPVNFAGYFFGALFAAGRQPQFYLSARLGEEGQWVSNELGAFRLAGTSSLPDLEAFGTGFSIDEEILEPRLHAFQPVIGEAQTLVSVFQDPPRVRIQTQQPVKRTVTTPTRTIKQPEKSSATEQKQEEPPQPQRNTRTTVPAETPSSTRQEPVRDQSRIEVEFDQIRFRPKQALSIRVLRPEDLIWLEFEFHNFSFSNRGQSAYLELENPKDPGVIVVSFPTQHTLEQAFFETTNIPSDPTNEPVNLPAKHLRAHKSRLVYELEAGHPGFPLILTELLDWKKFKLRVHPRAWIKIPQPGKIKPGGFTLGTTRTTLPRETISYLDSSSKDYSLRMAQSSKNRAGQLALYNETQLQKVLAPEAVASLRPSFDIGSLRRVDLKVGPIPPLSTSIEAPALMYISPNQVNDFYHRVETSFRNVEEQRETTQILSSQLRVLDPLASSKGEIIELWHTALGIKLNNRQTSALSLQALKTIRALWAFDAKEDYKADVERNQPFMASLDANNRHKLVHTTSNYQISGFTPFPVPVKKLMLTTLGAYLDWHAFFDVPAPADTWLNIIEWEHLATLGRDHYVKVVEEGYLFPFGHRAAVVKVTERKFHRETRAAVNRQRMFIVVLEKEVWYDRNDPKGDFIRFPFQSVRIENDYTPNIDNPANSTLITVPPSSGKLQVRPLQMRAAGSSGNSAYNFYINVGGKGFPFDLTLTDKEGQEQVVRMPLVFVETRIGRLPALAQQVIDQYNPNKTYNETAFSGQEVAYSEYLVDGDTAFETETLTFGGQLYPASGEADLKFHPVMQSAKVYIRQVDELTGVRKPATIQLEDDNNPGHVFASVADAVVDFTGGSDKSGGFLSPNMGINALSKLQGPVGGKINDLKNLVFKPLEFFEALDNLPVAKIFGVINLFDLLGNLDLKGSFDGLINQVKTLRKEIENLKNEILFLENQAKESGENLQNQIDQLRETITGKVTDLMNTLNSSTPKIPNFKTWFTESAFYAEYKWQPDFKESPIEVIPDLLAVKVANPKNALTITTTFEKPFDSSKTAALKGRARFEKFGIDIVPLLAVNFNYMEFRSGSAEKTDIKVDIDAANPIEFKGVLSFVNNLQSIIPSTGFSEDGPYIDIKPTGVTAGFDISVPNVEVGICMISNISLGASVTLPFTGAPLTLGFNFCKRENPFLLTVSCFGGGGYFMMVTTLHGIQSLEAAFEFGAAMSLNVGVASGGVSVMGGFYFKIEKVENDKGEMVEQATLTGYLRINGHLSILGLIKVSLEFYLALTAVIVDGKVSKMEGVATLKVKVEVLFFSKTVSVTVRRELAGADADPTFREMIEPEDWQEYCLAFAS